MHQVQSAIVSSGVSSSNTISVGSAVKRVQEISRQATIEPDLNKKREIYNTAYSEIRNASLKGESSPELRRELHILFESFVTATAYNQESPTPKDPTHPVEKGGESMDKEEGYRKSAALLELSFLMQLDDLNLSDSPVQIDWKEAEDLESLARNVGFINYPEKGFETSNSKLFDRICQLNVDPGVLAAKAQEQGNRDVLAKTLIRLTFSHQNVMHIRKDAKFVSLHRNFNALTETVIGDSSIEQSHQLADYKYQRIGFLIELSMLAGGALPEGQTLEEFRFNAYEAMKKEFEKESDDYFLLGKRAQCANMQGIILASSNLEKAEILFNEALAIRTVLLNKDETSTEFMSTQVKTKQHQDNEFLLANVRSGIVHCLVNIQPITEERRLLLQQQKDALLAYVGSLSATSNYNGYRSSYDGAIRKADSVLL